MLKIETVKSFLRYITLFAKLHLKEVFSICIAQRKLSEHSDIRHDFTIAIANLQL